MPKLKSIPIPRPKSHSHRNRASAARTTRWTPNPKFPVTQSLQKTMPLRGKPHATSPTVIVSEQLSDDIVQRIAPFLQRNAPVDILDLWPGPGILSSKINDLLKPRRHVLYEPEFSRYKDVLGPLAQSQSCYKLVSDQPVSLTGTANMLSDYLPEQEPSNPDRSGTLPMNDTLLVIANIPPARSAKDHFTGSRWISAFMEQSLQQTGLHSYGCVRLLASTLPGLMETILPRQITSRGRPSLLIEQFCRHAFEVAAPLMPTERVDWAFARQWETIAAGLEHVAQKAVENNVTVPVGREFPPFPMAVGSPSSPRSGPVPYEPRVQVAKNASDAAFIKEFEQADPESPEYKELLKKYRRTCSSMTLEDRQIHHRISIASQVSRIDEMNKTIARLAADPKSALASLEPLVQEAQELRTSYEKAMDEHHFDITRVIPRLVDDKRAAIHTGSFADSAVLHDRRPFEPLLIHDDELYPAEGPRTWGYFEIDPNPPVVQRMNKLDPEKREAANRFLTAFSLSLGTNNTLTVTRLNELFFGRSANDLVKAVPSLAKYAFKTPKPDFDSLPKTLHYNKDDVPDGKEPDPVNCYQENLDYNLEDIRCRVLSVKTLCDIAIEYAHLGLNQSAMHLNRMMGGTMTTAQLRSSGSPV